MTPCVICGGPSKMGSNGKPRKTCGDKCAIELQRRLATERAAVAKTKGAQWRELHSGLQVYEA